MKKTGTDLENLQPVAAHKEVDHWWASHTSVVVNRHTVARQFGQNLQQAAAVVVAVAVAAALLRKAAVHLVLGRGLMMVECSLVSNLV